MKPLTNLGLHEVTSGENPESKVKFIKRTSNFPADAGINIKCLVKLEESNEKSYTEP
jgi:hypothetical protein